MKGISLFVAANVLAVSCSVEEILSSNVEVQPFQENEKLGFVVKVKPYTRSLSQHATKITMPEDRFGVFAFSTGDNVPEHVAMSNSPVIRSSDQENVFFSTVHSDVKADGFYSFFAYYPFDDAADWTEGIRYHANRDLSSQEDLLYASVSNISGSSSEVGLVFRHALACISLKLRSLPNEYGHTVRVKSIKLGDFREGEHFYTSGTFCLPEGGVWTETVEDEADPYVVNLDDTHFSSAASALPADFTDILSEDSFITVIPKDFTSTGLPVEIDFSIMDGENVLMDDRLVCRVAADLRQGETFEMEFDLTPVPITFDASVEPWDDAAASF